MNKLNLGFISQDCPYYMDVTESDAVGLTEASLNVKVEKLTNDVWRASFYDEDSVLSFFQAKKDGLWSALLAAIKQRDQSEV